MINSPATILLPQPLSHIEALAPSSIEVPVGYSFNLVVVFSDDVTGDQVVSIATSDPTVLSVPSSVTVLDGESTADVPVTVLKIGSATVTATHSTGSKVSTVSSAASAGQVVKPALVVTTSKNVTLVKAPKEDPPGALPSVPTTPLPPMVIVTGTKIKDPKDEGD